MKSKKNWELVESNPPLFRKELLKPKDKEVVMQSMNTFVIFFFIGYAGFGFFFLFLFTYSMLTLVVFNKLGGVGLPVKTIFAVYNPSLVSQFNLTKEKLEYRSGNDKSAFFHKSWKNIQDTDGTSVFFFFFFSFFLSSFFSFFLLLLNQVKHSPINSQACFASGRSITSSSRWKSFRGMRTKLWVFCQSFTALASQWPGRYA
jgi:hypothetical protein